MVNPQKHVNGKVLLLPTPPPDALSSHERGYHTTQFSRSPAFGRWGNGGNSVNLFTLGGTRESGKFFSELGKTLLLFLILMLGFCGSVKADSPKGAIGALVFSPDGKQLAVGGYKEVVIFDTASWKPTAVFTEVEENVRSLAYHPDGHTLAIGSGLAARTGDLCLWDTLAAAAKPRIFPPQKDTVEALAFSKDGKALLAGSNDSKAHLYANLPYEFGPVLDEHNGRVHAVAFSPRQDFVFVTGAMDKVVKVWDVKSHQTVVNFDQSEGGISGLVFLPNGLQFVGASLDGRLFWWQVDYNERKHIYSGAHYRTVSAHDGGVLSLAISSDGARLITAGQDNLVKIWKADDGGPIKDFKDCKQPCYAVALNSKGSLAAAGGEEGVVRIWDVEANKLLITLEMPPIIRTAVAK